MRLKLASLLLVLLLIGCNASKNEDSLNGTWVPVKEEMGGIKFPASSFSQQVLTVTDNQYTMTAESIDKGEFSFNGNQIDIIGTEGPNKDRNFKAIYKIEGDLLTICYNLKGDSYPEVFSTQGESMYFMATFERVN